MSKTPVSLAATILWSGLVIGVFARPAQAYIDPGTGSILLQNIIGGTAGAIVMLKLYWHEVQCLFGGRRGKDVVPVNDKRS